MQRSDNIADLAAALAKAQSQFEAAERDHTAKVETRTGGNYSFNYADLAAYLAVCRKPLGDNGLSVIQEPNVVDGGVNVVTLLMHASGQWIQADPFRMPVIATASDGKINAQAYGSAITYARRYSLSSLIGMASESDDDGNAACGNTASTEKRDRPVLPVCPECGKSDGVIVGKPEFGGGFVCFAKKGGCGHKWQGTETKPTKSATELEAAAVMLVVTELAADIRTASTAAEVDAVKARCTAAKPRMSAEQSHQIGRLLAAAMERTKGVPTAEQEATANALSRNVNTTDNPEMLKSFRVDVADHVKLGELTAHQAEALTGLIDEKLGAA